jgi:hypothetical protein
MKHIFCIHEMLRLAGAQQTTPFTQGQRIGPEAAALLNAMPDIIEALKFYQAELVDEPTHFVPVKPKVVAVQKPPVTDEEKHTTASPAQFVALMHTYAVDKDGKKTKIE